MSNIKESDKVNNLQERIKNTQTLRILAIQQGEEKLEKLEEELRILPEKSETVTYFGWPELDETFNWTTFRELLDKDEQGGHTLYHIIKNTQTLGTLASQQGEEKLEKLEEELRNLPEESETVTFFSWPDLGVTFNWTAFREWLDKGQPYEEYEEILMFLNKNGVSNETKRSDGKPSGYCSILCM
ncbi:uncharacterized protein OCT59_005761 [Rhizophagus irregularis]|uniref:uncharacterized protein n=1 Tax=Rhizophagus irregularis TaxID=588596 RepID=UPI003332EBA8|nr:hypothetical protein OCT59_005761 [Rhizophagus irregularis]